MSWKTEQTCLPLLPPTKLLKLQENDTKGDKCTHVMKAAKGIAGMAGRDPERESLTNFSKRNCKWNLIKPQQRKLRKLWLF